jgi:hypothetical protein
MPRRICCQVLREGIARPATQGESLDSGTCYLSSSAQCASFIFPANFSCLGTRPRRSTTLPRTSGFSGSVLLAKLPGWRGHSDFPHARLLPVVAGGDRSLAVLVAIFGGLMPATIYFVNVVSDAAALTNGSARMRFPFRIRQTSAGRAGDAVPQAAWPSKHRRRDPLGSMAPAVSGACSQIAFPAGVSGRGWRSAASPTLP